MRVQDSSRRAINFNNLSEQILKKNKMYFNSCSELWFSDNPSLESRRKQNDWVITKSDPWQLIFIRHENLYAWMIVK